MSTSKFKKMKWWILALIAGSVVGLMNPAGGDSSKFRDGEASADEERDYRGALNLVYIGASHCGFSNLDSVSTFVSTIIARAQSQATRRDLAFRSIGIAADSDLKEGIDHLHKTGEFDQISVGSGWNNHSLRYYVTELVGGPVATPQIILVKRSRDKELIDNTESNREEQGVRGIKKYSVVYRAVGVNAIRKWANNKSVFQFGHNWLDEWYYSLDIHIVDYRLAPRQLSGPGATPDLAWPTGVQ